MSQNKVYRIDIMLKNRKLNYFLKATPCKAVRCALWGIALKLQEDKYEDQIKF